MSAFCCLVVSRTLKCTNKYITVQLIPYFLYSYHYSEIYVKISGQKYSEVTQQYFSKFALWTRRNKLWREMDRTFGINTWKFNQAPCISNGSRATAVMLKYRIILFLLYLIRNPGLSSKQWKSIGVSEVKFHTHATSGLEPSGGNDWSLTDTRNR
jgi:hypothetical protein